jgi:hypothetical protein
VVKNGRIAADRRGAGTGALRRAAE